MISKLSPETQISNGQKIKNVSRIKVSDEKK